MLTAIHQLLALNQAHRAFICFFRSSNRLRNLNPPQVLLTLSPSHACLSSRVTALRLASRPVCLCGIFTRERERVINQSNLYSALYYPDSRRYHSGVCGLSPCHVSGKGVQAPPRPSMWLHCPPAAYLAARMGDLCKDSGCLIGFMGRG